MGETVSPLHGLVVTTPSVTLRVPSSDDDFQAVTEGVMRQIHDPDAPPPFANDWTSREPGARAAATVELLRQHQAEIGPQSWIVELSAFDGDRVVGGVSIRADDFAVLRMTEIGLWVAFDQQGKGLGRHIVVAGLALSLDHWSAQDVVYTALEHNRRSLALADRLGFEANGFTYLNQHGERKRLERRMMTSDRWRSVCEAREYPIADVLANMHVRGADACAALLGVA